MYIHLEHTIAAVLLYSAPLNACLASGLRSDVQGILAQALHAVPAQASVSRQLFCLEVWMIWLCHLTDAMEPSLEGNSPAALEGKVAPYAVAAQRLIEIVVPCLSQVCRYLSINACCSTSAHGTCTSVATMQEGNPAVQVDAARCSHEAHSGVELEEHLAALALAPDTGQEAALAHAVALADGAAAVSNGDLLEELRTWAGTEVAVYCGFLENVVAQAVSLGGHTLAARALTMLDVARRELEIGYTGGGGAEQMARQVHVLCRVASRCIYHLEADSGDQVAAGSTLLQHGLQSTDALFRAQQDAAWAQPMSKAAILTRAFPHRQPNHHL